jgi:carbon monoxide dehydrogenase subunit G
MKLEQTFDVQAPLEQVWAALNDLERVAPCLPGAAITSHGEDGTYHGTFTIKLGPMTAAYNGTIRIEDADEAAHRATLKARGTDKRGQGGASATIVNTLSEHEGGTRVEAVTDFNITGRLAQFGRGGMMQDVSNRLLREFASCLSTRLAEPAARDESPAATADESSAATAEPAPAAGEVAAAGTKPPSTPPPAAAPPPTAPAAQPLKGGSLFFSVLWERIKALFKRR